MVNIPSSWSRADERLRSVEGDIHKPETFFLLPGDRGRGEAAPCPYLYVLCRPLLGFRRECDESWRAALNGTQRDSRFGGNERVFRLSDWFKAPQLGNEKSAVEYSSLTIVLWKESLEPNNANVHCLLLHVIVFITLVQQNK